MAVRHARVSRPAFLVLLLLALAPPAPAAEQPPALRRTDNGDSFEVQSNPLVAHNLRGRLLLVHGAMDDNVAPYNTYLVVDALNKANRDFDLIVFPHPRHGFGVDNNYMMRRRWDYFVRHLMGAEPPHEYRIGG